MEKKHFPVVMAAAVIIAAVGGFLVGRSPEVVEQAADATSMLTE